MSDNIFWTRYIQLCANNDEKPNAVARKIGISSGSVTKWKNGTIPSDVTLQRIASYFNTSVAWLNGNTDDSTPIGNRRTEFTDNEREMLTLFRQLSEREQMKWIVRLEDAISDASASVTAAQLAEVDDKTKNNRQTVRKDN